MFEIFCGFFSEGRGSGNHSCLMLTIVIFSSILVENDTPAFINATYNIKCPNWNFTLDQWFVTFYQPRENITL